MFLALRGLSAFCVLCLCFLSLPFVGAKENPLARGVADTIEFFLEDHGYHHRIAVLKKINEMQRAYQDPTKKKLLQDLYDMLMVQFDGCGMLSDYTHASWYDDFVVMFSDSENNKLGRYYDRLVGKGEPFGAAFFVCSSLNTPLVIFYKTEGGVSLYQFDTHAFALTETLVDPVIQGFGKREGDTLPVFSSYGDAGHEGKSIYAYNVVYQFALPVEHCSRDWHDEYVGDEPAWHCKDVDQKRFDECGQLSSYQDRLGKYAGATKSHYDVLSEMIGERLASDVLLVDALHGLEGCQARISPSMIVQGNEGVGLYNHAGLHAFRYHRLGRDVTLYPAKLVGFAPWYMPTMTIGKREHDYVILHGVGHDHVGHDLRYAFHYYFLEDLIATVEICSPDFDGNWGCVRGKELDDLWLQENNR